MRSSYAFRNLSFSFFFLFLAVLAVNNHGVTHQEYLVIFLKRCVVL